LTPMKLIKVFSTVAFGVCLLVGGSAWSEGATPPPAAAPPPPAAAPAPAGPETVQMPEPVQPPTTPPAMQPPAPPMEPPPPPVQNQAQPQPPITAAPSPQEAGPSGQWVYTSEYGWIWAPYGTQYTYEGLATDPNPYAYVYYPAHGWGWLAAPWVWGWGPYPFFGVAGPWHYPWYRGLVRSGYGWGRYRGGGAGRYWDGRHGGVPARAGHRGHR